MTVVNYQGKKRLKLPPNGGKFGSRIAQLVAILTVAGSLGQVQLSIFQYPHREGWAEPCLG